ncbi:T9SS type A sorting domain-containing protein [Flavobacterium sp. 25HG05S-40]|uniref:T9SS type A sorting domain-containing protein n=1 Tax=Flavobacterium sp. 25HG05S-40 TaxID=3458682 RepID=UPI0040449995
MKTTYIRIYLLVIVCSLKTFTNFAQPIIKVPRYCEVVVAGNGQGTSTGFGGAVGDGGIVVMPDPFDYPGEEGNFYCSLNEFELIKWELLGDLSLQTETNYNQAIQFVAGANPVNIQSYNKKLRFGEMPSASLPDLDTSWARSKGRIVVTYYDRRCINKITFDVYKRYKSDRKKNSVPPIDGADCVLPNTVYTFSVDPIASDNPNDEIGFDKYYWSGIPENCTLLYSAADNSSITLKTGENVPSFILQCCYGRANDWDGENSSNHTTCSSKSIISTLLNPEYIVAPPTCHPTGTGAFTIVYPNTTSASYLWTTSNLSWQITSVVGVSTTTVTVTTPDNNNGRLELTMTSACNTTVTIPYQVNRNLTGSLIAPNTTSPGSICMTAGSSNNQFFLGNTAAANNVTWTVTSPLAGAAANITLSAVSGQPSSTVAVAIGANAPVNTIYTLTATANTTPFPACTATAVNYTFSVRPQTPTFAGANCVVRGSSVTSISVNPVAGVATNGYTWAPLPAGVTCTANCNTVNPTFLMNGTGNTSLLKVTAAGTSGCNSLVGSKSINYYTVVTTPGPFSDSYAVNGACGTVTSWTVNGLNYTASSGNIGISGTQNNTLTISGSGGGPITQVCANYPGPIVVCATSFGTSTLKQANPNPNPKNLKENIIIFPNPNDGNFDIQINEVKESASATITDMTGKKLGTYELTKGENKIKNKNLSSGTYIVVIDVDGKQESQRIIIK